MATSALELGIDVPHLDAGVLVGVPRSGTSLMQRIGRVGRQVPGAVVIVNDGDVYSEAMFRKPAELFARPLAEGALYLENPRIQYIHAMCLARPGGEHDRALARAGASPELPFSSPVSWPPGFVELCARERAGEIPPGDSSVTLAGSRWSIWGGSGFTPRLPSICRASPVAISSRTSVLPG